MLRLSILSAAVVLAACADQSRGSALNECRTSYYLADPAAQEQLIPDCMKTKSFDAMPACNPPPGDDQWDWQVQSFPFNNPNCYRPVGAGRWLATVLSPM